MTFGISMLKKYLPLTWKVQLSSQVLQCAMLIMDNELVMGCHLVIPHNSSQFATIQVKYFQGNIEDHIHKLHICIYKEKECHSFLP